MYTICAHDPFFYSGNTPELYGQDGKPITVYHGTASSIEAFEPAKMGSMTRADDAKLGFFCTSSPETASGYANNALPQDLIAARDNYEALQEKWGESDDPKVAKEYRAAEKKYERMMADYRKSGNDGTVMEVYLSMKNPLVVDMKGAAYQGNGERYRKAIEQAKAQGYDGVIFQNVYDSVGGEKYRKKSDVYVVFTPEQIKSVGNVGTFDRSNPNVRYSINTDGKPGANVEENGNISVAKDQGRGYNEGKGGGKALDSGVIDKILSMDKGLRPEPSTYLAEEYINGHLVLFRDGVTKIMREAPTRPLGSPLGTFIMPKLVADELIAKSRGDVSELERLLGLDPGELGDSPVRIDLQNPAGLRMPTGNEAGANSQWIPGGYTKGVIPEAIIDQVPVDKLVVSKLYK